MDALSARKLRFDGYVLDPLNGRLTSPAGEVALRPKAFDVLRHLVANAGNLVAKEQLIDAVWPDVVVGDDSLVQCVREIRLALGDESQTIVRTIPRRGYMFTRPVADALEAGLGVNPTAAGGQTILSTPRGALETVAGTANASRPGWRLWPGWRSFAGHGGRTRRRATSIAVVVALAMAVGLAFWRSHTHEQAVIPFSVVVMPLVNVGADASQQYLVDGITEDLTTELSRIRGSFVIAHDTAAYYGGRAVDARTVGRELAVRYLVEGSIQRVAAGVVLNARLIDTATGAQVWSDRFARTRAEAAELQQTVVGRIASALQLQLIEAEAARGLRERPLSPDAHDLAMQAWSAWEKRTPRDNLEARALFQRAAAADPQSALAWAGLANTYISEIFVRRGSESSAQLTPLLDAARQSAREAYRLDPRLMASLGAWGAVLVLHGQLDEAHTIFAEQVRINPNWAPGHLWNGVVYDQLGRPREAIASLLQAIRLSPYDSRVAYFNIVLCDAYLATGEFDSAVAAAERAVAAPKLNGMAPLCLSAALVAKGDEARAVSVIQAFRQHNPKLTVAGLRSSELPTGEAARQQRERYYGMLVRAGLPER